MRNISILDPSVASPNLGDQIIIDAVKNNLNNLFENSLFIHFQTQDIIGRTSYDRIRSSDRVFLGGTNLLSSNMNSYNQWKIGIKDSFFMKDVILMGVGWWQYQEKPNFYTSILYKRVLSQQYLHSVRDSYTEKQLNSIGISNVVNTSCPTMWSLTEDHCQEIPRSKSDSVLLTFTEYNQQENDDFALFKLLAENYKKIYFWTQQPNDFDYANRIANGKIIHVKPSLEALDEVLELDIDYIGTRLHSGVRALQHKKRALILAVDNRAAEIGKDTGLPVAKREDIDSIKEWIYSAYETRINLPWANIDKWRDQFIS